VVIAIYSRVVSDAEHICKSSLRIYGENATPNGADLRDVRYSSYPNHPLLSGRGGYNGFLASIVIERKNDAGMLMIRKGSRNAASAVLVKRIKATLTSGDGWEVVYVE